MSVILTESGPVVFGAGDLKSVQIFQSGPGLVNVDPPYFNEVNQLNSFVTGLTAEFVGTGNQHVVVMDGQIANEGTSLPFVDGAQAEITGEHFVFSEIENRLIQGQTAAQYDGGTPNGFFLSGGNFAVGDVLTMQDGATLDVTAVDAGGVILDFTISALDPTAAYPNLFSRQLVSSVGPGTGFEFVLVPGSMNTRSIFGDPNFRRFDIEVFKARGFAAARDSSREAVRFTTVVQPEAGERMFLGTCYSRTRTDPGVDITGILGPQSYLVMELA